MTASPSRHPALVALFLPIVSLFFPVQGAFSHIPNPFNPGMEVRFRIADGGFVSLKVYDVLGREVATLMNEDLRPGGYERTSDGTGLATGIYIARLECGGLMQTSKLLLLR